MTYNVGQLLFIASNKELKIFPALVVEEVVRKSLNSDDKISYVVTLSSGQNVQLSDIKGDVYTSADDAKRALIVTASSAISEMVDNAVAVANETWPREFESPPLPIQELEAVKVKLPDGTVARMKK